MDIKEILSSIGNWVSNLTQQGLQLINDMGVTTSGTTAKILTFLIMLALIWVVAHFASAMKKPLKIGIIVLLALLAISIITTFI